MEIKTEINRASYIRVLKANLWHVFPKILLVLLVISLIFASPKNNEPFIWKIFLIQSLYNLLIALILLLLIVLIKLYKQVRSALKKLNNKSYFSIFNLTPDGININAEKGDIFYRWFEIKRVYAIKNYICILLRNKLLYSIPKTSFDNYTDEINFLRNSKLGISSTNIHLNPPEKSYRWGWLGLIPIIGAVNGIIMVISGISKYKNVKYTLIGIAGILFTIICLISVTYITNGGNLNGTPRFLRSGFTINSQMEMNSLVKSIEFYKLQNGVYPDSLKQLNTTKEIIDMYDPLIDNSKNNIFNYYRIGSKYTLFSSGLDEIPNTSDDIYPNIDITKTGLLINRK
ncbi:YcxB family protein [Mucilaginibacter sp.]